MTMVGESHAVETLQNVPETRGSDVREDVAGTQVQQLESLDVLAGRVAHDINNLLTVITSFGALVANDISAAQRDGCVHIENASADMERLLTAARRGAGLTGQLQSFRALPSDTGVAFSPPVQRRRRPLATPGDDSHGQAER